MDTNKFISIPFKEKGRDFYGCDCWGLGWLILKEEAGIVIESHDELYRHTLDPDIPKNFRRDAEKNWVSLYSSAEECRAAPLSARREKKYDFVLLRQRGLPSHVGIVVRPGVMIHMQSQSNCEVTSYLGLRWQCQIMGFYRHRLLI